MLGASCLRRRQALHAAHQVFDRMPKRDVVAWNAILASYVRWWLVEVAKDLFEDMPIRNASSWTTMIGGYLQVGDSREALEYFRLMQIDGVRPDKMTVVEAYKMLENLQGDKLKTVSCYNAIISGLAVHGLGEEAIEVFKDAEKTGIGIDDDPRKCGIGRAISNENVQVDPTNSGFVSIEIEFVCCRGKVGRSCWGDNSHPRSEEIYSKLVELSELTKLATEIREQGKL
ncbi:hypothetical protein HHK36_032363 [Tetracentron sinense]|uniref:Pentatricopeptide repeat-containing protein n=1 Tax=Tetracentron sinense TaxID=13715 RepID=A0A835CXQ8_TETSI|nr:hypothetical protein HHK36_032363 [Tetracentron sinense]